MKTMSEKEHAMLRSVACFGADKVLPSWGQILEPSSLGFLSTLLINYRRNSTKYKHNSINDLHLKSKYI